MTQEEWNRFHKVMVDKYMQQLSWWPTREQAVESIIGGVISDTSLLLDGSISLEQWEQAIAERV